MIQGMHPTWFRAICDNCHKMAQNLEKSAERAEKSVLNYVQRPWSKVGDKLFCDDCARKLVQKIAQPDALPSQPA